MLAFSIHEPTYPNYAISSDFCPSRMDGYPSPPPDSEGRHINQKYTTEEGDFIIYAWHDRKLKWQRIKQDFASMFGRTPERTVQGLQAWYYRMNQRIPLWDEDGWLIFENDDDMEPKHISIKCRERDTQDRPMEPLGLAQRYPERAIHYSWVDAETKRKCRDWGEFDSQSSLEVHQSTNDNPLPQLPNEPCNSANEESDERERNRDASRFKRTLFFFLLFHYYTFGKKKRKHNKSEEGERATHHVYDV